MFKRTPEKIAASLLADFGDWRAAARYADTIAERGGPKAEDYGWAAFILVTHHMEPVAAAA